MGVGYSSVLMFGMMIKDTITTTTEKAFPHDFPPEVKFCSKTGKPLWVKVETGTIDVEKLEDIGLVYYNVEKSNTSTRDPKTNKKIPGPTVWTQTIDSTPYYLIGVDVFHLGDEGEIEEITPDKLAEAQSAAWSKIKAYFDECSITDTVDVKMYQMLYCG